MQKVKNILKNEKNCAIILIVKFRVVKSKRKTLCLTVDKNGEILVRAPQGASEPRIAEFVKKHERWILTQLAKVEKRRQLNLSNHEVITLFSRPCQIREGKAKLSDGVVYLPACNRSAALLKLIKALARQVLTNTVEEIATRYGFHYTSIRISTSRGRWGSCSKKGVLSFTCLLAFVPLPLVRYVVVHELCHTRHFNHSKNFWNEVEKILPDWAALRAQLKKEGDCLDYLRGSD